MSSGTTADSFSLRGAHVLSRLEVRNGGTGNFGRRRRVAMVFGEDGFRWDGAVRSVTILVHYWMSFILLGQANHPRPRAIPGPCEQVQVPFWGSQRCTVHCCSEQSRGRDQENVSRQGGWVGCCMRRG